jgi:phosphoglycerate dehydrogenase-like enzyme
MSHEVIVLRPEADFLRVGVVPPRSLSIHYTSHEDASLAGLLREASALVIPSTGPKLPDALFEGVKLKLVQFNGAGVDRVDEPLMKKLSIPVCNVPGGSNSAMAEYTVASALTLLRRFAWSDAEIRAGRYAAARQKMLADNLPGIEGLEVGVVGMGTVGLAVARAFHAFGAGICYFDPAPRDPKAVAALGARPEALDELLRTSDIVTLHVPLLPATRGMIGARELALMKDDAVLIQASRGGVVDEAALAARLEAGKLRGVALDVYSAEPPTADHPLLSLVGAAAQRVLFTPHIAGVSRQAWATLFRASWENVERVVRLGEAPLNRLF